MKDIRLKEALKHCCSGCDYGTCARFVLGHPRKSVRDCKGFKKCIRKQNKTYRHKVKRDLLECRKGSGIDL